MDECNELLQDLAVNYWKEGLYRKYLEPVTELAEELSEEYEEEEMTEAQEDFYRELRAYENLLRSFLTNEVYSDLLTSEGDLEDAPFICSGSVWNMPPFAAVFSGGRKRDGGALPYFYNLQNDRI